MLFYGGTLTVLGILHNLLWWYGAYWGRLASPDLSPHKRRALTVTWLAGPVLYGASLVLALLDPQLSIGAYAFLAILYPTADAAALSYGAAGAKDVAAA